jgi:hypothetical protein
LLSIVLIFACSVRAHAYSLLTHEQLIDLTWDDAIVPLLLDHYPGLTPEQLRQARAFAYGGCVIQDIGYYPYGEAAFSNLTHYVRSGDFVVNLFRNAHNANELAFAVGALSHYIGDNVGHSLATNVAVPVEFPKLRAEYGDVVNYAEGESQHVRTEFAFDINEIAHHRMAPLQYLRSIGLGVAMNQLALAYYQTYGLSENFSGTRGRRVNVRGYRFAVHSFIPRIAYAETLLHRHKTPPDAQTPEAVELRNEIGAMATADNWQAYRHHAGLGTWSLAVLLFIVPKVGPLRIAAIKGPTADTEVEYQHSLYLSVVELRRTLRRLTPPQARHTHASGTPGASNPRDNIPSEAAPSAAHPAGTGPAAANIGSPSEPLPSRSTHHFLLNRDLDTGYIIKPGGYPLTDSTYASLLHTLTRQPNLPIPAGVRDDILAYYSNLDAPFATKKDPQRWAQVQSDLEVLKAMPTSPWPPEVPTYEDDVQ